MPIHAPPPELPPRYRLWPDVQGARLGSGGAATVWRVQDQDLGVLVALKVLKDTRPGFLAKMEREAVLSSRVVHPNVVAVHDIGRTPDGRGYLAFALASDGTMLDLAAKPPPWAELKALTIQLLEALAALHARGILHLDVKLSNLLLHRVGGGRRQLWLADLGVARALWDDDDDKSVVGTVSYMSPERLTGQHHLWCPSTDLFAVGGVLFRLITGRLPYPARDPTEGLSQRQRPPRKMVPRIGLDIPEGLDDVILPMLQFDRRSRFDLAADVIRALELLPEVGSRATVPNPGGAPEEAAPRGVPTWYRPRPCAVPAELPLSVVGRRVPQAPSLLSRREIELVGREPELELLWRAARTAMRTRRPVLVEVTGPPGAGRTRLLEAFTHSLEVAGLGEGVRMQYAVASGTAVGLRGAWGRIAPTGSRRDLFVREIATSLARDRGVPLDQTKSDARLLAGWMAPGKADPPASGRAAVRAMLVEHLDQRAWRGLSWLWVEDAHLAGENDDCWAVLDQVLTRGAPIVALVDAADDRITPALLELRARHPNSVRRIQLEPLKGRAAQALVQAHLPLESTLAQVLAPRAGAQPKLFKDLLAHWVRTGELQEQVDGSPGRVWALPGGVPELPPDGRALAEARLASSDLDAAHRRVLEAVALAGNGVPESVIARLGAQELDQLLIDGLVDLQQGRCVLQPAELAAAACEQMERSRRVELHRALADAWSLEGQDAVVARAVGEHRMGAGDTDAALEPLHTALSALADTLPVYELEALARRTLQAAGKPAEGPWVDASLVLADALWRGGDADGARAIDKQLAHVPLAPEAQMTVLCARIRRALGSEAPAVLSTWLDAGASLLPSVRTPIRADFHATRAWVLAHELDTDGALAEVLDALSCRPQPVVGCRARLLRARLLSTLDPMVSWHEALRVVETARAHGLLRYQVLAWGLAGDSMVFLGRGDEAIERLRSGVDRLEAHGERVAARTTRVHLGSVLMAAGREAGARGQWTAVVQSPSQPDPTLILDAQVSLGLLATRRGEARSLLKLVPERAPHDLASRTAWCLLLPVAELQEGLKAVHLPDAKQLQDAVRIGIPGLFAASALIAEMRRAGRHSQATAMERHFVAACAHAGVDPDEAKPWLERRRRAQR